MTKFQKFLVAALLVIGGSAVAVQQLDRNTSSRLTHHLRGILLGPATSALTDARVAANRISHSGSTSITTAFYVDGGVDCSISATTGTIAGAAVGDACLVGQPALIGPSNTVDCFVSAANTVSLRNCSHGAGSDAGSLAFEVRTFSNN